jgi:hypothetical protein
MKGKAFILSSILTLIFLSLPLHAETYDVAKERIPSKMATLSFPFIENKGQVHEDVAYYAKTFGGTVFVTKDGRIVYNLPEGRKGKEKTDKQSGKREQGSASQSSSSCGNFDWCYNQGSKGGTTISNKG